MTDLPILVGCKADARDGSTELGTNRRLVPVRAVTIEELELQLSRIVDQGQKRSLARVTGPLLSGPERFELMAVQSLIEAIRTDSYQ